MDGNLETVNLLCSSYSQQLKEGVSRLFDNQERTDIIISFNDWEIRAHQMMIAIFAPKLLDIIDGSKCDLSSICIDEHLLANIFEFIYKGQVNVAKECLENLKRTAEQLKLNQLVDAIDYYHQTVTNPCLNEDGTVCVDDESTAISKSVGKDSNEFDNIIKDAEIEASTNLKSYSRINNDVKKLNAHEENYIEEQDIKTKSRQLRRGRLLVQCPHCSFETIGHRRFLEHLQNEHDVNVKKRVKIRYKCVDCEFTCDLRSQLSVHRKTEHGRKRLRKCPDCNFSSVQKRLLDRHIQNAHSTDRPFPCKLCDYRAKCSADLYAHRTTHRGEKYKCDVCSAYISSKKNFNKHRKIHENPDIHKQPHRCQHCTFRSWTKTLLAKHLKRVHNCEVSVAAEDKPKMVIPEDGWQCSMCDYKTKEHNRWIDHLAVKHQIDDKGNKLEPSISCQYCTYTCFVQSQIRRHMLLSHSNKRFKCEYCNYVSYNKTQVSYHVKAKHFQEKPFMCETCGMKFVTECLLRRHVLTHGNDKYMCDICKKSFALKSYLRKHMKHMHDISAKKHMCHMCAFVTKTKDALNQHIKRMHKEAINVPDVQTTLNPAIIVEEIPL